MFENETAENSEVRHRARGLGITPGILPVGPANTITDVPGVLVGQVTLIEGEDIRTGATAVLPHGQNIFQDKVPAGLAVGNGFGKLMGSTQLNELGELETPILLTNTLSVPRAAEALLDWTLAQPGNEQVVSVNMVVGETNDSQLNNIRRRSMTTELMIEAIYQASSAPVTEGAVGAGTGTVAFGWKGGIGSSSRILPATSGGFTLGVLVQSNFGGVLQILGVPVGTALEQSDRGGNLAASDGSIMIIIATDAPLSDRNLKRLARRGLAGLARTGAAMSHGSGDYVIAFSTAEIVRRTPIARRQISAISELPDALLSPLFQAAIEATEEAILNSLFMATTVTGYMGRTIRALPLSQFMKLLHRHNDLV